ncbi:MAG: hypothetical protein A3C50_03000 [Candidatus Staskawiczbacteria bacterium RIFCSPHIGHO2_02_FULL_43_16]|uniref:NrS-1 polymerase-like HBD domain-containing protein n=1 Tax=Candidatus Staskawiczbacteria bacterium RIFCSPHIGHO2_01_FULL_41_41 TaxID=1802203 RepID=A0A1G2HRT6_9BACT|nr:MAG: hypothetical protein A2822_01095 [Candidatus Staskawiczbacteria bacterium RIFCSPHIGHO2_01_FULL_41_41]OGZ68583.1 MAG: hypothetical protein A3C50_03000 [Candidatus Staskawiczbacteria bacterium RIFCSPHIGHO2_02_FULL_43_16]
MEITDTFETVGVAEDLKIYIRSPLIHQNILGLSAPDEKRWVNWRYELVKGKWSKVPYQTNGKKALTTVPATWNTLDMVMAAENHFNGIGIVFNETLLGIDIDHCIENNQIAHPEKEKILEFINRADTYCEISPSGTGLHIFLPIIAPIELVKKKHAPYEIYTWGRYFTITGIPFGTIKPIRAPITPDEAISLISILGYPWAKETRPNNQNIDNYQKSSISLSDEVLRQKMFASQHGAKIQALYNGDTSDFGGDESVAEASLCSHLAFWTGKDAARIESLWLASPLGSREKTQKRKDYREKTIDFAIKNQTETYKPSLSEDSQDSAPYFEFMSDTDLLAMNIPPITWHIESLFEKSTLNMIAAPSHQYKSMLVLRMALSVAHGFPLFNHFETLKSNVLIVSEEDGMPLLKHRYEMLLQDGEKPGGIYFIIQSGKKINEKWAEEILKYTTANNIQFVILDSLRALHTKKENDSDEMQSVMDVLLSLARKGLTVLFVHHNGKGQKEGIDGARGSSGIVAAVHGYIACETKKTGGEHIVVSQLKLKAAKSIEPFVLNVGTRLVPERLSFDYAGLYNADKGAVDTVEAKMITYFREHQNQYFTRQDFVDLKFAKSVSDKTLRSALKNLTEKKRIGSQEYSELSVADRELMPDKNHKPNAVVYILTD